LNDTDAEGSEETLRVVNTRTEVQRSVLHLLPRAPIEPRERSEIRAPRIGGRIYKRAIGVLDPYNAALAVFQGCRPGDLISVAQCARVTEMQERWRGM
jgi:hypothetical protein